MIAPRMLGPEVRRCYEEGEGFISAIGVQHDATGRALPRLLAVAAAIGGLRQGALALSPAQEAFLDLAVEQILSPALTHVNNAFVGTMLAHGIPIEAVLTELFLSGEVERNDRLLREEGFVRQLDYHSPTSQYGQLSRRGAFDALDYAPVMERLADDIESGRFADEWDAESSDGGSGSPPCARSMRGRRSAPSSRTCAAGSDRRSSPVAAHVPGTGERITGMSSGMPPSAMAIFEKPMNRAMPAASSTTCAGEKCASRAARRVSPRASSPANMASVRPSTAFRSAGRLPCCQSSTMDSTTSSSSSACSATAKRRLRHIPQSVLRALRSRASSSTAGSTSPALQSVA